MRLLVVVGGLKAGLPDQAVSLGCQVVAVDHLAHQFSQRRHRRPAQLALGLARIAEQPSAADWHQRTGLVSNALERHHPGKF